MTDWLTVANVRTWTDVPDETSDESLQLAVDAVMAYVPTCSVKCKAFVDGEDYTPPADVLLGSVMLAARWHDRRGATLGTTGYTEFGSGTIMRHDPDIARMLGIGTSATRFSFGAPTIDDDDDEES